MDSMRLDDTIVGVSTAIGEGGIGIIRMSGKDAFSFAEQVFSAKKKTELIDVPSHSVHYGHIQSLQGDVIDEVLLVVMKNPKTYTKQDMVEIQCHGGTITAHKIIDVLTSLGARLGEPGEFTKRAFLNGRIDLSQAEAIMDIISSKSNLAHSQALVQLEGGLSGEIQIIVNAIVDVLAEVESYIDFPEEDIPLNEYSVWVKKLSQSITTIESLLASASFGKLIKEGISIALCGVPNVGKSSLLNALLKQERMIVSDIPGTTRDSVDESISYQGIQFRFFDTAGIADSQCVLEKQAVERARGIVDQADICVFVIDGTRELNEDELSILDWITQKNTLITINKIDEEQKVNCDILKQKVNDDDLLFVSALKRTNIDTLLSAIKKKVFSTEIESYKQQVVISNLRHKECLENAKQALGRAFTSFEEKMPFECGASDIKEALMHLGHITGENVGEDVLNRIFERFCIGK